MYELHLQIVMNLIKDIELHIQFEFMGEISARRMGKTNAKSSEYT